MGVCSDTYFVILQGIELTLGMGVGSRPLSFESIFSK